MSVASGGTIVVRVEGKDVGLTDLLARINQQMASGQATIRNYAAAMVQLNPAAQKAEQAVGRYAQSLAQVAQKSGDTAGAIKILASALQNDLTPGTTAANQAQSQLQTYLNQTAKQSQAAGDGLTKLAIGVVALQGAFNVTTRVIREFNEILTSGNELEKTLTTFRVLSGSAENYQRNLAAARDQQKQFGGSLQATVDNMSEFANLSKRTGIEIEKLSRLARGLAIIDPAQTVPLYSNI